MLGDVRGEPPLEGMTRADFLKAAGAAGLLITASGSVIALVSSPAGAQSAFSGTFVEPLVYIPVFDSKKGGGKGGSRRHDTVRTNKECIERPNRSGNGERFYCKPSAGSIALLPDGRLVYWNALEGSEDTEMLVTDFDKSVEDDQSRVLKLGKNDKPEWLFPFRSTGTVRDNKVSELLPGLVTENRRGNNGGMFCSSQCHLPDESILVVGGTQYYQEGGAVELQGLSAARVFDPPTNRWYLIDAMNYGRWYPGVLLLANGDPFVCSGVHKLIKPVYTPPHNDDEPPASDSGRNVLYTEILDLDKGKWKENGPDGERSLPLQPRIHLLPNGHVCFNGAGQSFSPAGESVDQATWNIVGTYNPKANEWSDHGVVGMGTTDPLNLGGRYSTFEVPLLMEPDENGDYKKFELLTAGGTIGAFVATNPGTFTPTDRSRIDVFEVDGNNVTYGPSRDTGPLGRPKYYPDGVLLPDGKIFTSSGGDKDHVFFPGAELPIRECELFDPEDATDSPNGSWSDVGLQTNKRTYHNVNNLLADGRVLIGGHNPIPFGYVSHDSDVIPGTRNRDGRDPTFEIYSPPYVFESRPEINAPNKPIVVKIGKKLVIPTPDGDDIDQVVVMRLPSTTHLNDTEQRGLVLPVIDSDNNSVTARMPKTLAELGGPGFVLAFILSEGIPSEGMFVKVPR